MIKRIITSLCIGFILTLLYAEHDTWAHQKIGSLFKRFCAYSFCCFVDFERIEFSFFKPSCTFHNMSAISLDGTSWSLRSTRCEVHSSWLRLWEHWYFPLTVVLDACDVETVCVDNTCAFFDYCFLMLQEESLMPVALQSLTCAHTRFNAVDAERDVHIAFESCGNLQQEKDSFCGTLRVVHMSVRCNDREYITDGIGTIAYCQTWSVEKNHTEVRVHGIASMPFLSGNKQCAVHGVWRDGYGRFSLRDAHGACCIDPLIITQQNEHTQCVVSGRVPVDVVWKILYGACDEVPFSGTCACSVTVRMGQDASVSGCVTIEQLAYNNTMLASSAQIVGRWRDHVWRGSFSFLRPPVCGGVRGVWEVHDDNTAYIQCENNGIIHAPGGWGWAIMPRDVYCALSRDNDGVVRASYTAHTSDTHRQYVHDVAGSVEMRNGFFVGRGSFDAGIYMFDGTYEPQMKLTNAAYYDEQGQCSARLSGVIKPDEQTATLDMRFAWLRGLIRQIWGYDVYGDGMCYIQASHKDNQFFGDIALRDAHIRIPGVNNFIHEVTTRFTYDRLQAQVSIDECNARMHTGRISCAHASFGYNDTGYFSHACIPLVMHHCLLHPHNDVYATISGHVLARYTLGEGYSLTGDCLLDRAYLKESPFAVHLLKQFETQPVHTTKIDAQPVHLGLAVESKEPIRIETSHINARALVDMRVKGTMQEPSISGGLKLVSGDLFFPYRSLSIVGGGMQFDPKHLYDPQIQLIAKDKVRSYMVGLHATGSLQHPEIILESWPLLTDEQIASLLLTGSEHEGLNIMMPAVITQRLNQMIFGKDSSESVLSGALPMQIHFVPSFTNQTARGGLRAAVEIDIGDRWHALIQKNFSLSEDTRVEIEYQATDDITVRAIRDERRDIRAEFEIRWKF